MRVISSDKVEFVGGPIITIVSFAQLIQYDPGAPRGLILVISGFIDGKFLQEVAFHQDELVMSLVTRIDLSIHHGVRQDAAGNRLVPYRKKGVHRSKYPGGISVDIQHHVGISITVKIIDLCLLDPASQGEADLSGAAIESNRPDRHLVDIQVLILALHPITHPASLSHHSLSQTSGKLEITYFLLNLS